MRVANAKIAVITGTGAGVGRAAATEFARNGRHMTLPRDPECLERAAAELRAFGVRALPIPNDGNKIGRGARPVAPIYQPEVPARAIYFGALHPRRHIWVGFPTVKACFADRIAPGLLDRFLAESGYSSPLTDERRDPRSPGNHFEPVRGSYGAHGRFDSQSREENGEMLTSRSRHRTAAWAALLTLGAALGAHLLARRLKI